MIERNGFEVAPERDASWGLDWSDAGDRKVILNRLTVSLGELDRRHDGALSPEAKAWREKRLERGMDRLEVCLRAVIRDEKDERNVSRECLNRMAECVEAAEGTLLSDETDKRDWEQAVHYIGEGVRHAHVAIRNGAAAWYQTGTMGGLVQIAALLDVPGLLMDAVDLAKLSQIVNDARELEDGQVVAPDQERCRRFFKRLAILETELGRCKVVV